MKSKTKTILNFALIFGTLAIVLLISAGDKDLGATFRVLGSIKIKWALLCTLCLTGFMFWDAVSVWYFLRRQGYRISLGYAMFVAIIGQYYSNITPGASGGQPMQIYYLYKRGIPVGIGTSALIVRFFSFQFMLSVLTTAFWIGNGPFVAEHVGDKMWVLLVGFIYNCVMVLCLVMLAMSKRVIGAIIGFVIWAGAKLHLIRDPNSTRTKWMDVCDTFCAGIQMMRKSPVDILVQLCLGGLQLINLMSVIYFVYLALGGGEASFGEMISLHLMEYCSAAYTPLPGASGAQEGVFSWYFGKIFTGEMLLAALLLWRFFTYYLTLLVGAVTSVLCGFFTGNQAQAMNNTKDVRN